MKTVMSLMVIAVCMVSSFGVALPVAECAQESVAEKAELININAAEKDELLAIRGIGPTLADRIIAYRAEFGSFALIEDIKKVPGIGDVKFQQIQSVITV